MCVKNASEDVAVTTNDVFKKNANEDVSVRNVSEEVFVDVSIASKDDILGNAFI
jgi:hypothetical protein